MKKNKLLKDSHPHLFKEIHPTKNGDIELSNLRENSSLKIFWECPNNPKHIYLQPISRRTKQGYGCSYCSGRYTLREESFAALYPRIAAELHPTKNGGFDPYKCRPQSNKEVWWKCENGHEWLQKIGSRIRGSNRCKKCRRIENSLATKYPEIAKEWHPTKNGDLKPEDVLVSYKKQVWWQCRDNTAHEWKVLIRTRIENKTGCPQCSKNIKRNTRYPSLQEYDPLLSNQWHPTKNGVLKPTDFKPNSSTKVWWLCPVNSAHEWESIIRNRALQGKGCPFCSKNRVSQENSFSKLFPNIAKQWHPVKNGNMEATDFSYGSAQKVWWQCPDDKSHEWQATIVSRTTNRSEDCPVCSKESNSLERVFPEIAKQWHPTKNGRLKPSNVTRASGIKVWWLCPDNPDHEWEAIVKNRTVLKSKCPECAIEKNTIRLQEHLFDIANSDINNYHVFLSQVRTITKFLDITFKDSHRMLQPFYRMLYSSIIAALETYLSDTFTVQVLKNEAAIEKFILADPKLNNRKYSHKEVIAWIKDAKGKVSEHLFTIVWHNFDRIKILYKEVLGVCFPDNIDHLYKAIYVRHDIVHRNGRKKTGGIHSLKKQQLLRLISDVKEFVAHLNSQIN